MLTEKDDQTAAVLQSFFKSVFVKEENAHLPHFEHSIGSECCLPDISLNLQIVSEELKALNVEKEAGPDDQP